MADGTLAVTNYTMYIRKHPGTIMTQGPEHGRWLQSEHDGRGRRARLCMIAVEEGGQPVIRAEVFQGTREEVADRANEWFSQFGVTP